MAKPLKLNLKPDYNFILIGIVTSEPIYRLAWLINEQWEVKLAEAQELKLYHIKKAILQDFSFFVQASYDENEFELVSNKGPHGFLIEEQKQIDYFLKIYKDGFDEKESIALLKGIKNISLATKIEPGSLKSKDRLLFTVEED